MGMQVRNIWTNRLAAAALAAVISGSALAESRAFSHYVAFELAEDSPKKRAALTACLTDFLEAFELETSYTVSEIAAEMNRPVNDKAFQLALHVMLKDKATYNIYAAHPTHVAFVEKCQHLWKAVRVFDSYVAAHGTNR